MEIIIIQDAIASMVWLWLWFIALSVITTIILKFKEIVTG